MARYPNSFGTPGSFPAEYGREMDAGVLARFFNAVYAWMAAGLGVTALVAWWASTQPNVQAMLRGPIALVLFIAMFVLVGVISVAIRRINASVATVLFILYAGVMGLLLSSIFLAYAHATIFSAFAVTGGMFGAMSLYGFVTRRDLTGFGRFLFMGLIGLIIAMVVSIFWHPTMLTVLINFIGVFIFVGLTAYDTQRLKAVAYQTANDPAMAARMSINGALMLYLDFLNLFLFVLSILGGNDRRR